MVFDKTQVESRRDNVVVFTLPTVKGQQSYLQDVNRVKRPEVSIRTMRSSTSRDLLDKIITHHYSVLTLFIIQVNLFYLILSPVSKRFPFY